MCRLVFQGVRNWGDFCLHHLSAAAGKKCFQWVRVGPSSASVPPTPAPALHSVSPMAVKFGGCSPPNLMRENVTRGGGFQIFWCYASVAQPGGKDIWWTARTARGRTGHLGLTEPQRGRLWTACGQRRVDNKNSQTTPATTSTSSIRQLLGAADAQTAHHATFSTAPTHQLLGSANAETTPARAPAAAADRKQRPDATCEGKNG